MRIRLGVTDKKQDLKFSQLFRCERRFDNTEAQYMQLKHDIKHMRLVLCTRVTFVFHLNISFFQDWDGQVELATQLLGHHFEVRGVVVHGDERGRTIGFPTANIEVPNQICIPADGVYAGIFDRQDGSKHICAINLGRRPTFLTTLSTQCLKHTCSIFLKNFMKRKSK